MTDPTADPKSYPMPPLGPEPIKADAFAWAGDFHYIEDICPDLDEVTKKRVWNRIMEGIDE